jgi:hypothetical protein
MRKLWDETFGGLLDVLALCRSLSGEQPAAKDEGNFDFGDFGESGGVPNTEQLDIGSIDFAALLGNLDEGKEQDDSERWKGVLEKVASIEYGLRAQHAEATQRREVALSSGETNQVLGLLDDTQSAASEGVHALVAAVYETFAPDVNPASVVPGYLTSLGRALLVRRGLADLASKLALPNAVLQSERGSEHEQGLTIVRHIMRSFVASVVCRAMRAADRWQMVQFEKDLQKPLKVSRLVSEGLVKYIESLASINQREVLLVHDQRTIDEMRDALANARQLIDLSPNTAREMMERAFQAAQRLRGRHSTTDALIIKLEKLAFATSRAESLKFLEALENVLAAMG